MLQRYSVTALQRYSLQPSVRVAKRIENTQKLLDTKFLSLRYRNFTRSNENRDSQMSNVKS